MEVGGRLYEVRVWLPPGYEPSTSGDVAPPPTEKAHARGAKAGSATPDERAGAGDGEVGEVTVPMQGTVVKVLVKPGDSVQAGQVVCVLEAMKMENNIVSEVAGAVLEVRAEPGASVGTGDVLVVVGPG